jgi:ADP-heptose:LPS heptosyltransferase
MEDRLCIHPHTGEYGYRSTWVAISGIRQLCRIFTVVKLRVCCFAGQTEKRKINPEHQPVRVPKFLLLRFSSIGDIVLTTPVVRGLKQQVPGAEIHFMTRTAFEPVLRNNPYIDRIITFDKSPREQLPRLKAERYDAIIDLHHNRRTFFLKLALGGWPFSATPAIRSFRKLNVEKWLLVNLKINRLPELHIVDRYLETVRDFGVTNDGLGLDYFISADDEKIVDRLPPAHKNGYTAVVIGAQHATKRLPVYKLIQLCRSIEGPVVLLGGPEDATAGLQISHAAGSPVYNACGLGTINESAALIKHAVKVISNDTGLMHIAAAFKRPVDSYWGNTVPAFGMTPYYGNQKVESKIFEVDGLRCRPCSKIGFNTCPKGHFNCMEKQVVD